MKHGYAWYRYTRERYWVLHKKESGEVRNIAQPETPKAIAPADNRKEDGTNVKEISVSLSASPTKRTGTRVGEGGRENPRPAPDGRAGRLTQTR